MRPAMRAAAEGFYAGLGYIGFLALAGLSARDSAVLSSAVALAMVLGGGCYFRTRRPSDHR
jgi:hypothetical protein